MNLCSPGSKSCQDLGSQWQISGAVEKSSMCKSSIVKRGVGGRRDYSHVRVCVHGNEDSVRGQSPIWIYRPSALLPSGHSSATSRTSRRLHHTYAAEHYITENDEPRVQSPGTLASSTCVMRRAQRASATADRRYTRNSRNRNSRLPLTPMYCCNLCSS